MPRIVELPYRADASVYAEAIVDRPWSIFLDSGGRDVTRARYDILAADPWCTLVTRGDTSELSTAGSVSMLPDDPFKLLARMLGPPQPAPGPLPFYGGAIGCFTYDLGRRIERLRVLAADDEHLPQMIVGLYAWALIVDHAEQRAWLVSSSDHAPAHGTWEALRRLFESPPPARRRDSFRTVSTLSSNVSRDTYAAAFERVMRYIRDGDCYQINLAQRFELQTSGDPWIAYQALRASHPAPFGAYMNLPFGQVLSISPERFLEVRGGHVVTAPIKGTRPRADDPSLDVQRARELAASAKDRAENLMIVDLLRNDLAKNCRIGSVRVPRLFEVQSFPSVHHLVSTVTGELAPGRSAVDLLRGCFPGGSITGAPKLRAMEIIEELEPHRRGLYCGAIGYVGHDGAMDTSIAIRTLVHRGGCARFWAGGGLVSDSVMADEYQETLDKAAPFIELAQRFAVANPGN